jgi:hypothetical protein
METKNIIISILVFLFGGIACAWIIQGNDFFMYKVFAPQYENVRRETFENTKSYNEGMAQELRRYQLEYIKANPEQKKAIRSIVLHQYAGYENERLPNDLYQFMNELKTEEGLSK